MSRNVFAPDSCVVADVMPSPNHGERIGGRQPDMILLHYTGMRDPEAALELLKQPLNFDTTLTPTAALLNTGKPIAPAK